MRPEAGELLGGDRAQHQRLHPGHRLSTRVGHRHRHRVRARGREAHPQRRGSRGLQAHPGPGKRQPGIGVLDEPAQRHGVYRGVEQRWMQTESAGRGPRLRRQRHLGEDLVLAPPYRAKALERRPVPEASRG
jgi:hypothetical protein